MYGCDILSVDSTTDTTYVPDSKVFRSEIYPLISRGEIIKSGKKIILHNYFSSPCFYKGRFAVVVNRITLVIIEQSFTSDFAYQL